MPTKISWTDETFNPWQGCSAVSEGCRNCYAARIVADRYWGPRRARRKQSAAYWAQPLKWNARAAQFAVDHGRRRRVFCASVADVFDPQAPRGALDLLFDVIEQCPELDWQILTKRPQLALPHAGRLAKVRRQVWFGVSAEDQDNLLQRTAYFRDLPAALHFVSYEPALGPLDLRQQARLIRSAQEGDERPFQWLIAGGESGPLKRLRRPRPEWFTDVRDQCAELGIPFLFKQWGSNRANPAASYTRRNHSFGYKGGHRLEGAVHDAFPTSAAPAALF